VILPLKYPELYDNVCRVTRKQLLTSSRPKAILFDGPPGTGKTTTARIIASQVKVPLVGEVRLQLNRIPQPYAGEIAGKRERERRQRTGERRQRRQARREKRVLTVCILFDVRILSNAFFWLCRSMYR
jgi:SpoVK/Ycf46/Vps4 family AAA+-type ATPase